MLAHYWGWGTKAEHVNLGYSLAEVGGVIAGWTCFHGTERV